jgi:hypothetical protein
VSSPIHSAQCIDRRAREVRIELAPTTACGAHFPVSKFFALALLHEAATSHVVEADGTPVWQRDRDAPLASATTFEVLIDLSSMEHDDADKAVLTDRFIARADCVDMRNWTPALWRRDAMGAFDGAPLDRRDPRSIAASRYLQSAFDGAWAECERLSRGDSDELWRLCDERLPHATLRVEVTNECWIEHIAVGMRWEVYAFDDAAPTIL